MIMLDRSRQGFNSVKTLIGHQCKIKDAWRLQLFHQWACSQKSGGKTDEEMNDHGSICVQKSIIKKSDLPWRGWFQPLNPQ